MTDKVGTKEVFADSDCSGRLGCSVVIVAGGIFRSSLI